jgi:uncharacterized glyoxalase superfamily protein PhnB
VARQPVLPQLRYDDPNAAVAWLCRVFGFREVSRMAGTDGTIHVADLRTSGDGAVLVSGRSPAVRSHLRAVLPDDFREGAETAWPNLSYSITVMVPDVDAHYDRARREGARLISEPTDQPWGLRDYEAVDLEGRQWNFSQHLHDAEPQEWGATPSKQ